jgi:hypothetical protein
MRYKDRRLYGQGAPCKSEEELDASPQKNGLASSSPSSESEVLSETVSIIEAFGAENREPDFDWDKHYGGGFSVINMAVADSNAIGRHELVRAASQLAPCTLQPTDFFLAWNGVLTLVYEGFPSALVLIKQQLNNIQHLRNENFGTMWPKTTLAATQDDAPDLTLEELKQLKKLCLCFANKLKQASNQIEVNEVSLVKYSERSLEAVSGVTTVPLKALSSSKLPETSEEERTRVKKVLNEWEDLEAYLVKANAPGSRIASYRNESPHGSTVVAFLSKGQNKLKNSLGELLDQFRCDVDAKFPGRFVWLERASLHCSLRSLDLDVATG